MSAPFSCSAPLVLPLSMLGSCEGSVAPHPAMSTVVPNKTPIRRVVVFMMLSPSERVDVIEHAAAWLRRIAVFCDPLAFGAMAPASAMSALVSNDCNCWLSPF
jgi:hypothetical protein